MKPTWTCFLPKYITLSTARQTLCEPVAEYLSRKSSIIHPLSLIQDKRQQGKEPILLSSHLTLPAFPGVHRGLPKWQELWNRTSPGSSGWSLPSETRPKTFSEHGIKNHPYQQRWRTWLSNFCCRIYP